MSADILVVDDEAGIRTLIKGILEDEGYTVREAGTDEQAYEAVKKRTPDLIILDIWLQNSADDGLRILETIKKTQPLLPVLMISGHGNIETAVNAIKIGAYDFIEKPFKSDRLLLMIERALENAKLRKENERLRVKVEGPTELVGKSAPMVALIQAMDRMAQTNSRILITGEAGAGKELAARYIHRHSQRADKPFVVLNCAILRPERLEIELFGLETGTTEEAAKTGMLELAHGGTLFLDEVADMPLETQGKIVRVLQEQLFQRVGGQKQIEVDVRIITATNRDLQEAMTAGDFRQDLYYRISVVPVEIPPLRKRKEDIQALAAYFSESYSSQTGRPVCSFDKGALAALQAYDWPGNVRQLKNVIEWLMIMGSSSEDQKIGADQLPSEISNQPSKGNRRQPAHDLVSMPLREARETFERDYLESQIKRFGGNISKTADFVGMERSALHRKMKQLGISAVTKQNDTDSDDAGQDNLKRA